jgi:transcriptional regulator with XRE-family HTH domain
VNSDISINHRKYRIMAKEKMAKEDSFGWRLMMERKRRGWQQKDVVEALAKRLKGTGITSPIQMTYSRMENGEYKAPRPEVLMALADVFGFSVEYLVTGKEPEATEQFATLEANQVARLLDTINDDEMRSAVLALAQTLAGISRARSDLNFEFYELMRDTRPNMPPHLQIRFDLIARKLNRDWRNGG